MLKYKYDIAFKSLVLKKRIFPILCFVLMPHFVTQTCKYSPHLDAWGSHRMSQPKKDAAGPIWSQPARAAGPVGSWGRPPRGGGGKKQEEGSNFPVGQLSHPTSQSWGGGARKREWVRKSRPNGGRGWAQQPAAQPRRAAAPNHLWEAEEGSCNHPPVSPLQQRTKSQTRSFLCSHALTHSLLFKRSFKACNLRSLLSLYPQWP